MSTALVVVDVQESVVDEGVWNADGVIDVLNRLIGLARGSGTPVVFVYDNESATPLHSTLQYQDGDTVVKKDHSDAFQDTVLDDTLKSLGVRSLVMGGMQTDFCVQASCRGALRHGYDVLWVADAHTTIDHSGMKAVDIIADHNRKMAELDGENGSVQVVEAAEVSF